MINAIRPPLTKLQNIYKLIKNSLTKGKCACKNTKDFIDKITLQNVEERDLMISLDIDNIHANIPRQDAIKVLKNKLVESLSFLGE